MSTRTRSAARVDVVDRPVVRDADPRVRGLAQMLRVRRFEERCVELYSSGHIKGFLHLGIGQEAVAVGVLSQLQEGDAVVATYREHGHALVRGVPMASLLAEMFAKVEGCSRGRGGSMHLFDASRRFYGGNAIVAGGIPLALGLALGDSLQGREDVTACFFGDGAVAEGEFHETANLAALWRLPLLLVCENNRYAMGTAIEREHANTELALRAASYGMPAWVVDGMDLDAVAHAARGAVDLVRAGGGPVFLELRTYRFRAHSMYDPERYRDKAEVERWKERDPIPLHRARLAAEDVLDATAADALDAAAVAEVDAAVAAAEQGSAEPVEELLRWVLTEVSDERSET